MDLKLRSSIMRDSSRISAKTVRFVKCVYVLTKQNWSAYRQLVQNLSLARKTSLQQTWPHSAVLLNLRLIRIENRWSKVWFYCWFCGEIFSNNSVSIVSGNRVLSVIMTGWYIRHIILTWALYKCSTGLELMCLLNQKCLLLFFWGGTHFLGGWVMYFLL